MFVIIFETIFAEIVSLAELSWLKPIQRDKIKNHD